MSVIRNRVHVGLQVRVVYGVALRNALSRWSASVECAGRWFTTRAPPADDAARRGAALNLLPAEKDATPGNPAQLMPGQR